MYNLYVSYVCYVYPNTRLQVLLFRRTIASSEIAKCLGPGNLWTVSVVEEVTHSLPRTVHHLLQVQSSKSMWSVLHVG